MGSWPDAKLEAHLRPRKPGSVVLRHSRRLLYGNVGQDVEVEPLSGRGAGGTVRYGLGGRSRLRDRLALSGAARCLCRPTRGFRLSLRFGLAFGLCSRVCFRLEAGGLGSAGCAPAFLGNGAFAL